MSDRYRLMEEIGRGGMAVVYAARDLKHDRDVAVKTLPEELMSSGTVDRFHREIQLAAGLNHPHIVPIFDSGEADGLLYYVMPRVDGETLKQRLGRVGRLSVRETLAMAVDVAAALDHAHEHGVVHRDIKPANIFLTGGDALVADFGIAVSVDDASDADRLTSTGLSLGTPRYMSPEQLTDPENVDWRSDVFSLAVVLWECLTGELPFGRRKGGGHPLGWIAREPGSLGAECPAPLSDFLLRCLAVDADERWQDRGRLAAALAAVWDAVSELDAPAAPKRNWPLLAALVTVVLLSIVVEIQRDAMPEIPLSARQEAVVTWASRDFGGRLTPSGDEISFVSDRDGGQDLWVVPVDGGPERRITQGVGRISGHAWSPDGDSVAFITTSRGTEAYLRIVGARGGDGATVRLPEASLDLDVVEWIGETIYLLHLGQLWTYDTATKDLRQLSGAQGPRDLRWVDVRADGEKMVFATVRAGGNDLWVANPDGTDAKRLADDDVSRSAPCWLGPSGEEIAYISNESGQRDVWRMRVSDGSSRPVTGGSGGVEEVSCGPDGTMLVLGRHDEQADIWLRQSDGRELRLTADSREDLMPSAAGERIAFQRTRTRLEVGDPLFDASVMVGSLGEAGLLNADVLVESGFGPEMAPGGEWVSFLRWPSPADAVRAVLGVADATGRAWPLSQLYTIPTFYFTPPLDWYSKNLAWAPDGTSLFFLAGPDDGPLHLFRADMAVDGPTVDSVAAFGPEEAPSDLTLSPTGGEIAFVVESPTRGVQEIRTSRRDGSGVRTLYTERSASALQNVGWLSDGGPLVVLRSFAQQGSMDIVEPILVDAAGAVTELATLEGARGALAQLHRSSGRLLVPRLQGGVLSLESLDLDEGTAARWTTVLTGVPFSALDVLPDGRLLYVRHEINSDIWKVVFN